jgi:hypothetical protein
MALTEYELKALRSLIKEELQGQFRPFRDEVDRRFDEVDRRFEGVPQTVRSLLQEELKPFRDEVNKRFDEVATQIDGLYQRDEKREQEYLFIREQIRRLGARPA